MVLAGPSDLLDSGVRGLCPDRGSGVSLARTCPIIRKVYEHMEISRRDFMKYCSMAAAGAALSVSDLGLLEQALANPNAPTVIWLHGAGCTGCSVSFLNRISTSAPQTAADVLISSVNLTYHPTLMSLAGDSAAAMAMQAVRNGNYVLAVEGGVPTAFAGCTCWVWTFNGQDVTMFEAVNELAAKALKIVAIGNCASFGCVPAAPPNPTGIKGVKDATGRSVINLPGCPVHPDWVVWAIVQILTGASVSLDSYGRPTAFFSRTVHDQCPRRETEEADTFGIDSRCLKHLGCRGPITRANCPNVKWNGAVNWCVDANAPCIGCTEPTFPLSPILGESGGYDD